jgi:hypothetical protein
MDEGVKGFNQWLCKSILLDKLDDESILRAAHAAFGFALDGTWIFNQIDAVRYNQNPPNQYDWRAKNE